MSRGRSDPKLDCKVYIGDLGYGAAKQEIEDVFSRYGSLKNVWIARNPPGFAFVEYDDPRDVDDACRALDGTRLNGRRVRVEASSGKSRWGSQGPPRRGGGGGGGGGRFRSDRDRFDGNRDSRRRSRSRSRSPRRRSYSPKRSRSRSRSPIRSRYDSDTRSPDRR